MTRFCILLSLLMYYNTSAQYIKNKISAKATNMTTVRMQKIFTEKVWKTSDSIGSDYVKFYKNDYGFALEECKYHFYTDNTYTLDFRLDCSVEIGFRRIPYRLNGDTLSIVSDINNNRYVYRIASIPTDTIIMKRIHK